MLSTIHRSPIATMMNESMLRNRQIRNFFGIKVHLFWIQSVQYPTKTEPQNKNEVVYTQKSSLFRLDDKHRALETGRCGNTSVPFENSASNDRQLPDPSNCRLRQKSATSDPYRFGPIELLYCYINTAILLMLSIDVNSSLPDDRMHGNPRALRFI